MTVVLRTFLSHWRRRPGQLAALILGLALATALWSGVQALNAEARASYDRAAQVLGGDRFAVLVPANGTTMDLAEYVTLRRAGWNVSPVLEGVLRLPGGQRVRLLGIDPLTLPPASISDQAIDTAEDIGAFLRPPYRIIAAPETLERLGARADLPPGIPDPDLPLGIALTDIALAEDLLDMGGQVTRLVLAPSQRSGLDPISEVTGARLVEVAPETDPAMAQLTDSFHMNLTAFGLLSFAVGLFIVNATIGLAFEQRRAMIRTLRAIGTSRRQITLGLLIELLGLGLLSGALGMTLGYGIAAALLPDVAASLRGLYGADLPGQLSLRPAWWIAGFAMTLAGTFLASAAGILKLRQLPVLAAAQPRAWYEAQQRALQWQGAAAVGLVIVGIAVWSFGTGLIAGFALMGAVMMGAALALPVALSLFIRWSQRFARGPVSGWFLAESRAQLGGLSLALMALLLALAVNIGVGAMVSSFRSSFLSWLDQRLAAELYVRSTDAAQAAEVEAWLLARPEVRAALPIQNTDLQIGPWPFELYGIRDDSLYRDNWPLIQAAPDVWDRVADGTGVLISEQLARRLGLGRGDPIRPGGQGPDWAPEVVGIYPDYGNPIGQAVTSEAMLNSRWPETPLLRFAVRMEGPVDEVAEALRAAFAMQPGQAVDQASLKAFSREVFERTFTVTLALNALTFAVAGLALMTSLLTLADMRLPQLAPVWAMGLTRAQLARLELLRTLAMALLTAILAIPLGVLVAWILLAVVNVEAFGWRLPLKHYPGQWLWLIGLALLTGLAAAAWPARRLGRTPPALLLRIFSDAR
ncbi:MAG: FtsX-like permease family protein [Pseudomonadota bacterium]